MPRLRRPLVLVLSALLVGGIVSPLGALGATADECEYYRTTDTTASCGGGGGGGGGGGTAPAPTTFLLETPLVARFDQVAVSATVGPVGIPGDIQYIGETTVTTPTSSPGVTLAFSQWEIGTRATVTGSYLGTPEYAPTVPVTRSVYLYGSATVAGTVTAGSPVTDTPVQLVDLGGAVVSSTRTNMAGEYSLTAPVTTEAEAWTIYRIRAEVAGEWMYHAFSGATDEPLKAVMGGPTQWRPGDAYDITLLAPTWTAIPAQTPVVGQSFSYTLAPSSSGPTTFAVVTSPTLDALPAGLSLDPVTGVISGTPTELGDRIVYVNATNAAGTAMVRVPFRVETTTTTTITADPVMAYGDFEATVTVTSPVGTPVGGVRLLGATKTLQDGSATVTMTGNSVPREWIGTTTSMTAAFVAADIHYRSSTAVQSFYMYGAADTSGIFRQNGVPVAGIPITLETVDGTVIDSDVTSSTGAYTLAVDEPTTIAEATATYRIKATTFGGVDVYYVAGASTTSAAGTAATASLTGPTQWLLPQSFNTITNPVFTDTTLATPRVGSAYSDSVAAQDPQAVFYSVAAGALPAGLALDAATGAITGIPTSTAAATFTVRAFTSPFMYGYTDHQFTLTPLRAGIVPSFMGDTTVDGFAMGEPFSDAVTATGDPDIVYSLSGIVPAGITIDADTGAITGTPLYAGPYSFTVRAENEFGFDELSVDGWVDAPTDADLQLGFTAGTHLDKAMLTIEADGLELGSAYTLTMFSAPRVLYSGTVGTFRSFSHTLALPADTPVGAHRLLLTAVASDGTPVSVEAWFTLREDGTIGAVSYTGPLSYAPAVGSLVTAGVDPQLALWVGLLLVLAGMVAARRRRTRA